MAKAKRNARFDVIARLYAGFKSGNQTADQISQNLEILEYFLTEAELPKFTEQNPEVDLNDFTEFLKTVNGFKVSKKKSAGGNRGGGKTHLNTVEAAQERGVAPENVESYISLVNSVYETSKQINALMTQGARVSFAIPMLKEKAEEAEVNADTSTNAVAEG